MFERLKILFQNNKITSVQLDRAVVLSWITAKQKIEIMKVEGG